MILYRQKMVFMSLAIDLLGKLNYHVIACDDLEKVIGAFRSVYIVLVGLLLVKLSVQSFVCLL